MHILFTNCHPTIQCKLKLEEIVNSAGLQYQFANSVEKHKQQYISTIAYLNDRSNFPLTEIVSETAHHNETIEGLQSD